MGTMIMHESDNLPANLGQLSVNALRSMSYVGSRHGRSEGFIIYPTPPSPKVNLSLNFWLAI